MYASNMYLFDQLTSWQLGDSIYTVMCLMGYRALPERKYCLASMNQINKVQLIIASL